MRCLHESNVKLKIELVLKKLEEKEKKKERDISQLLEKNMPNRKMNNQDKIIVKNNQF
jgi:hypothetical protein